MAEIYEQEITVTGSLINITLFQDKMMRNFLVISNRLRKLEGLFQMQQKQKAIQKEFKFLTMKVDTIVEKLPKDAGSVTRNDVKMITKDIIFEVLNASDDKLTKTKYHGDLMAQINKTKEGFRSSNSSPIGAGKDNNHMKKQVTKTSFTAGQALRESERQKIKLPRQSLQDVLDEKQMEMVSQIVENKQKEEKGAEIVQLSQKFDDLAKMVEQLRLGRGYASFLERQAEKFQKFQQFQQKSRQTARRQKDRPIQLQGIKVQNVKGQVLKSGLLSEVQKMEMNKQQIARHQLMQKKTIYTTFGRQMKGGQSYRDLKEQKQHKEQKDQRDGTKQKDPYISNLNNNNKDNEGFKRSHSIRKLDKLQKRLRVDDIKELNGVLREIQLRIQTKVSHDIFMGFVKDIQQKLQIIRLTRDNNADINQLRKNIFVLQSKLQSVVAYLQSVSQQDDAMFVKKQWTCISCDKGLQKYQGKVGQHLNWESIASKKISPTKLGAFGQTGQLAAKIRNLMDGQQGQE